MKNSKTLLDDVSSKLKFLGYGIEVLGDLKIKINLSFKTSIMVCSRDSSVEIQEYYGEIKRKSFLKIFFIACVAAFGFSVFYLFAGYWVVSFSIIFVFVCGVPFELFRFILTENTSFLVKSLVLETMRDLSTGEVLDTHNIFL